MLNEGLYSTKKLRQEKVVYTAEDSLSLKETDKAATLAWSVCVHGIEGDTHSINVVPWSVCIHGIEGDTHSVNVVPWSVCAHGIEGDMHSVNVVPLSVCPWDRGGHTQH